MANNLITIVALPLLEHPVYYMQPHFEDCKHYHLCLLNSAQNMMII